MTISFPLAGRVHTNNLMKSEHNKNGNNHFLADKLQAVSKIANAWGLPLNEAYVAAVSNDNGNGFVPGTNSRVRIIPTDRSNGESGV